MLLGIAITKIACAPYFELCGEDARNIDARSVGLRKKSVLLFCVYCSGIVERATDSRMHTNLAAFYSRRFLDTASPTIIILQEDTTPPLTHAYGLRLRILI